MKVHFVCTGNAYRSRLAEAFFNSKRLSGFTATSSGIKADFHRPTNGPISLYTRDLLEKDGILQFTTEDVTQTTLELLKEQDLVVFMDDVHIEYCTKDLGYTPKDYEIWHIKDVNQILSEDEIANDKPKVQKLAAETYEVIKSKVDALTQKLKKGEKVAL